MKSHYSIISAAVRPEIDEKLTIGLLLVSSNEVYFEYSKNKLLTVKTLIESSLYKYLTETIRQIEKSVELEASKKGTILEADSIHNQFSEGYISYMNRYSNNLLNFSSPIQIDMPVNATLFDFLYKKYVDSVGIIQKKVKPVKQIKEEFYPSVKDYYNTDVQVTPQQIKGLPLSVNIDVVGKNEIEVFAQIIDFERPVYNITQDVGELNLLMGAFDDGKSKNFLIGDEPNKEIYPKSHDAWADLRNWNKLECFPLDEIERLKDYAVKHGVKPLFETEIV